MKKAFFIALAFLMTAAISAPAPAAELKIAYANLQKALNDCEAGIKAKEDLKAEAQKLEEELNTKQEELKKLKEEIDKKASVWNKETKEQKEKEFKTRTQEFQKRFMEYGDELNRKKQETEATIIGELRQVVEDIAKKKGYSYVFERSVGGILYGPADADITDEVIKTHNKGFKAKGR